MCDKAKSYLAVFREYSHEIIMLIGFGIAAVVYHDNKEQQNAFTAQQAAFTAQMERMTDAMSKITLQLHDLEKKIESSNK